MRTVFGSTWSPPVNPDLVGLRRIHDLSSDAPSPSPIIRPATEAIDQRMKKLFPVRMEFAKPSHPSLVGKFASGSLFALIVVAVYESVVFLAHVSFRTWGEIVLGLIVTFLRVILTLAIALAWTIPVGVLIGTNAKLARMLQPLSQMAASFPATALYPLS